MGSTFPAPLRLRPSLIQTARETGNHPTCRLGRQCRVCFSAYQAYCHPGANLNLIISPRSAYSPDISLIVYNRTRPPAANGGFNLNDDPYLALVFEIGDSQSLPNLCGKARKYFSNRTTIRIIILDNNSVKATGPSDCSPANPSSHSPYQIHGFNGLVHLISMYKWPSRPSPPCEPPRPMSICQQSA